MASKKVIKEVRDNGGWDGIEYSNYEVENRETPEKKREQPSLDCNKAKAVSNEMSKAFEKVLTERGWINVILRNEKMGEIMEVLNEITAKYGLKPRHNLKILLDYTKFEKVTFNTCNFIIRYRENMEENGREE